MMFKYGFNKQQDSRCNKQQDSRCNKQQDSRCNKQQDTVDITNMAIDASMAILDGISQYIHLCYLGDSDIIKNTLLDEIKNNALILNKVIKNTTDDKIELIKTEAKKIIETKEEEFMLILHMIKINLEKLIEKCASNEAQMIKELKPLIELFEELELGDDLFE